MFMNKSKMVKGVPFDVRLPENTVTRAEAMKAFEDLRAQTAELPEMTLEEINAEISATRAERKQGQWNDMDDLVFYEVAMEKQDADKI